MPSPPSAGSNSSPSPPASISVARRWTLPDLGALLLCFGVAMLVFWRTRGVGLIGWDSLPEVASSRIGSLQDFLDTFVERTAEGYYPFKFYRPVFNLSIALDYAIWGLDPVGYQLSSALLFGACGFALYRLTRGLLDAGPRAVGPWIALAAFFAAPFHLEVVAIVSRRMDLIAGLFVSLALSSELRRCRNPVSRFALVPALFTLVAIGAKEIAVVVPPLVFLLVLLYARPAVGPPPWLRAILATVPHVAAIVLCVAARLAAFGELGGHPTTRLAGAFDLLPWAVGHVLVAQLGTKIGQIEGVHLTVGIATLLVTIVLCIELLRRPGSSTGTPAGRALAAVTIALAWLIGCAGVFGTVGLIQAWYLMVPRLAFGILVGAVAQLLVAAVRVEGGRARVWADLALAGIVLLTTVQLATSSLLREPRQLLESTEIANDYLANLRARIDSAPPASIVGNPPAPLAARIGDDASEGAATTVLTYYTVQAWLDLVYPGRQLIVLPRSLSSAPVEVRRTTTVVELDGRFARLPPMTRIHRIERAEGTRRPKGADPASIKEALRELRTLIEEYETRQRTVEYVPPPRPTEAEEATAENAAEPGPTGP